MSNKERALEFIAKFEALDVTGIIATFAEDALYHNIPMQPLNGIEAIRGFIEPFMEPITEIKWELLSVAEDANGVVLTERVDHFIFGDKRVVMPVMGTFEFDQEKLVKWRDYFDLNTFEVQMAALQE
ncbi:MAG: limonene-1,2-epoxide hydrolase family protein [Pseudomonadota bacterium]